MSEKEESSGSPPKDSWEYDEKCDTCDVAAAASVSRDICKEEGTDPDRCDILYRELEKGKLTAREFMAEVREGLSEKGKGMMEEVDNFMEERGLE